MSNTSLNCSGPIQFTCVGTDIPNTLIWRVKVNDTDYRGEYAFVSSHNFPRSILLSPSLPGVEVLVINVSISNQFHINIASTLTSAAMLLNGATIQCADGANVNSTVYHIDIIGTNLNMTHPSCKKWNKGYCIMHRSGTIFTWWEPFRVCEGCGDDKDVHMHIMFSL